MVEVEIRVAGSADAEAWAGLRAALWPGEDAEHGQAVATLLARSDAERLTLLALVDAHAVGFAEAAIRHGYVNGCNDSPVAFLEGLYVAESWRRQGIAGRLVERVADWGRIAGCTEFASDAAIDNEESHLLHRALGFAETERVVFFRRALAS